MLLKKKCKSVDNKIKVNQSVDFNRLPPCSGALRQHINRTNYTVKIWKSAHIANPEIPEPVEIYGWTLVNGNLEPLWILENIMPDPVADLVEDINTDGDNEDSEAENDNDDELDDDVDNEEEVGDDVILNLLGQ